MSFSVQSAKKNDSESQISEHSAPNELGVRYQHLYNFPGKPQGYYPKTVVYCLSSCLLIFLIVIVILSVELSKSDNGLSTSASNGAQVLLDVCPCGPLDTPAFQTAKNQFIRGVNIGGFLVIEPNVSPSLFYQFMGMDQPPIDMMHFCSSLGPDKANEQLRGFWEDWITRDDVKLIKDSGINTIRVPVGYWMFQKIPDEPYKGCTNGSIGQLNRLLGLADEFDLDVVIDLHAAKDSQNGFDNSAWTRDVVWNDDIPGTYTRLVHPHWNDSMSNVDETVEQVANIAKCYTCHKSVVGLSVLNEPFFLSDDLLKNYYTACYRRIKQIAPHWQVMGGDNFQPDQWHGFWSEQEFADGAVDTHIYHIFQDDFLIQPLSFHLNFACEHSEEILDMQTNVIVGEWSLATDDCAMWLLGLNQVPRTTILQQPGFFDLQPPSECGLASCPNGKNHPSPRPGVDGPSKNGLCTVDAEVDKGFLQAYALRQLHSYEQSQKGWFFWNFKNEMEPRWSWLESIKQGLIPKLQDLSDMDEFVTACEEMVTEPPLEQKSQN